jgi:hypothetical protein
MLNELTPEQKKLMIKHRDAYVDFICNNKNYPQGQRATSPQILQKYIPTIYKKAGLTPPKFTLVATSYRREKKMINHIMNGLLVEMFNNPVTTHQIADIVSKVAYERGVTDEDGKTINLVEEFA